MGPFTVAQTGELFVDHEHGRISEAAIDAEDMSTLTVDGRLYVSVVELLEFLEESIAERELIHFYSRALNSYTRGDWTP